MIKATKVKTLKLEQLRIDGGTQTEPDDKPTWGDRWESHISKQSAQQVFREHTYLSDYERRVIFRHCTSFTLTVPIIEYHRGWDKFVFHSLSEGDVIYKKACAEWFKSSTRKNSEEEFENYVCAVLDSHSIGYSRQVNCSAGTADIVTDVAVVELKLEPGRSGWQQSIGQTVAYRASLGVPRAAILSISKPPTWVVEACRSVRIECFTKRSLSDLLLLIKG